MRWSERKTPGETCYGLGSKRRMTGSVFLPTATPAVHQRRSCLEPSNLELATTRRRRRGRERERERERGGGAHVHGGPVVRCAEDLVCAKPSRSRQNCITRSSWYLPSCILDACAAAGVDCGRRRRGRFHRQRRIIHERAQHPSQARGHSLQTRGSRSRSCFGLRGRVSRESRTRRDVCGRSEPGMAPRT